MRIAPAKFQATLVIREDLRLKTLLLAKTLDSKFQVSLGMLQIYLYILYLSKGYSGYIPGVACENVYATTYSRATIKSSAGAIPRGIDQPSNLKYETSSGAEYIKHNADAHASVSDVVGVQRSQDTYKKVSYYSQLL